MNADRPDSTLQAAVESMFRIRATESKPDAAGTRTVWHRGAKFAELVSTVDGEGKLTHQDFFLYDDILTWKRGAPPKTGSARHANGAQDYTSQGMVFDDDEDLRRGRLERICRALQNYTGGDKYIIHVRSVAESALRGMTHEDDNPVTMSSGKISRDDILAVDRAYRQGRMMKRLTLIVGVIGALVAVAVVAKLLLTR